MRLPDRNCRAASTARPRADRPVPLACGERHEHRPAAADALTTGPIRSALACARGDGPPRRGRALAVTPGGWPRRAGAETWPGW